VQNRGKRGTARGSGSVNKFALVLKSARGVDLNGERAVRGGQSSKPVTGVEEKTAVVFAPDVNIVAAVVAARVLDVVSPQLEFRLDVRVIRVGRIGIGTHGALNLESKVKDGGVRGGVTRVELVQAGSPLTIVGVTRSGRGSSGIGVKVRNLFLDRITLQTEDTGILLHGEEKILGWLGSLDGSPLYLQIPIRNTLSATGTGTSTNSGGWDSVLDRHSSLKNGSRDNLRAASATLQVGRAMHGVSVRGARDHIRDRSVRGETNPS